MALEDELVAIMRTQCPRMFATTASGDTPTPYGVWQHIGGTPFRFFDNSAGDKRNAHIQVTVWALDSKTAITVMRAIEDALCAATDRLTVNPLSEPIDAFDETNELKGVFQSFSVWGPR